MTDLRNVRFVPGASPDRAQGLLGYLRFEIGGLVVDGVTLRRTREGELRLSFPERRDRRGGRHPVVRPVDARVRQEIEWAVVSAFDLEDRAP